MYFASDTDPDTVSLTTIALIPLTLFYLDKLYKTRKYYNINMKIYFYFIS